MRLKGNGQLRPPTPTIGDYWTAIYRRKWLIVLVAVAAGVSSAMISKKIPGQYEAKAVFYVPRDVQGSVGIGPQLLGARLPSGVQDHAKAFAEIIKQPDAWRAVHERYPQKPFARFSRDVDIVAARPGTIEVYVRDRSPDVAANVANALVEHFNVFNEALIRTDLDGSMAKIATAIAVKDQEIFLAIDEHGRFLEKHRIASLSTQQAELERRRIALDSQLLAANLDRRAIDDQLASVVRQISNEAESYEAGDILVRSSTLTSLEQSLASLEVRLAGRRSEVTEAHPDVEAIEKQIDETRRLIETEVNRLVHNEEKPATLYSELRRQRTLLHVDRDAVGSRISGIEEALTRINEDIRAIPAIATESALQNEALSHLRVARSNMENTRIGLMTRSLEIRDTALVIQQAEVPQWPAYPIVTLNIAVATILGVIVGIIYALLIEHAHERRRVRKLENLEIERWAETLLSREKEKVTP